MKFLLNASNLHVGGCVQVAVSAIQEISLMLDEAANIDVLASETVDQNLRGVGVDLENFASYRVFNSRGIRALWEMPKSQLVGYDAVFTFFGPLYTFTPPVNSIVGFAQSWIIYPDNEASRMMPWWRRGLNKSKYWVQSQFFRRADLLVAELEHVRTGLLNRKLAKSGSVVVVNNAISGIYSEPARWQPLSRPSVAADLLIGFLGRNYPHKNTSIFPDVHHELRSRHGIDVRFLVTFTDEEWQGCSDAFRACSVNVGPLKVTQCPSFYKMLDAVIFPSLLECFSVTPLEAMAMGRPLFASDRGFVRDVCGPYATYFDPMSPVDAAKQIADFFHRKSSHADQALDDAKQHALNFSRPEGRARSYIKCLYEAASMKS